MEYKRIKITLVACIICVSINGAEPETEALMGNLPGYAITTGIQQLNSTRCRKEMEEYRDAVNHRILWSLKMLDISGQPSSGFIFGNNYWTGNRQQCAQLSQKRHLPISDKHTRNNSIYRNPAEEFPPFELNFFSAHVRHNSTIQYHIEAFVEDIIVLGLCLPASCGENEVGTMLTKMFDDRLVLIGQLYSTDFKLIRVSNLKDDHTWLLSGKMITILFIFTSILGTVAVGTLYDVFVYQRYLHRNKLFPKKNLNTIEEKEKHDQEHVVPSEMKPISRTGQFLVCFSAYSNIKKIFIVEDTSSSGHMLLFHGLKFFGMIWIIFAHSLVYVTNVLNNRTEELIVSANFESQIISNASFSVDIFFFISGFLLSFAYLKGQQMKDERVASLRKNMIIFIMTVIKRYIRLTPVYLITTLYVIIYFSWYEKISLYYFDEPMHELCSKYWWRNILYINNFFKRCDMCMTSSWYLSNDMQFYIFGLFLLTLSTSYYYTALILGILTLFLSTVLHAYVTYAVGYIPTLDVQYETLTYIYIRPWMRIQPHIVGMGTAVLLTKLNFKLRLSRKTLAVCWFLSVFCNCSVLFGISNRNMSLGVSVLYEALSRFAWSLGIAWLVIACVTNNAGVVNKFLSLPYWIPLSRLTYCAYLINLAVIMAVTMGSNYPFHFDLPTNITIGFGLCIMIYICALILCVTVELPMTYFQSFITFTPKVKSAQT